MINPAVEYACQRFAELYKAPDIMKELNPNREPGVFSGSAVVFALLFPDNLSGLEKYSRQELAGELVWFVRGYLDEKGPSPTRFLRARSLVNKELKDNIVKYREAFQKGREERQSVLNQIEQEEVNAQWKDLEARLPGN